jgi:predicted dehydrogenase
MDSVSRRTFLGGAAAGALTASGYARVAGANERLRIGVIGCGGMATGHMRSLVTMRESDNFEIAAVCDIYTPRVEKAASITGGKIHKDYREILELKDIDYVLIATPEHWHYR